MRAYPSVIDASECTYAEYYRAYGTQLTSAQALNRYVEQLEKLGWREVERTENTRFLNRGQSELLNVATYPLTSWLADELDPDNRAGRIFLPYCTCA